VNKLLSALATQVDAVNFSGFTRRYDRPSADARELAGLDIHPITVHMRLERDVLAGNDLGQPQTSDIIVKDCSRLS